MKTDVIMAACRLLDMLRVLNVIGEEVWLKAHYAKWAHKRIGKPEWSGNRW